MISCIHRDAYNNNILLYDDQCLIVVQQQYNTTIKLGLSILYNTIQQSNRSTTIMLYNYFDCCTMTLIVVEEKCAEIKPVFNYFTLQTLFYRV